MLNLILMLMPALASLMTAGFRIMLLDAIINLLEVSNCAKTQHHIISETLYKKSTFTGINLTCVT